MKLLKKANNILRLSFLLTLSLTLAFMSSCQRRISETDITPAVDTNASLESQESPQEYIDSFIFLGESTTYHLKSRGVLSGGRETTQVWAPPSGTVNLDLTVDSLQIIYPESGELTSLSLALSQKQPKRILLCFGLNGAVLKIKRGEDYFRRCYLKLTDTVKNTSPNTEIFLAACYPISKSMDMSAYTVDAATLNGYIDTINGWTEALALSEGFQFVDLGSMLKNTDGFLAERFDVGDGHHLNTEAYITVLNYLAEERNK